MDREDSGVGCAVVIVLSIVFWVIAIALLVIWST